MCKSGLGELLGGEIRQVAIKTKRGEDGREVQNSFRDRRRPKYILLADKVRMLRWRTRHDLGRPHRLLDGNRLRMEGSASLEAAAVEKPQGTLTAERFCRRGPQRALFRGGARSTPRNSNGAPAGVLPIVQRHRLEDDDVVGCT